MASQALASLTATYTDSEGEEDMEDGQTTPEKSGTPSPRSETPTAASVAAASSSLPNSPRPAKRLVSYNDDADRLSDDDALDKSTTTTTRTKEDEALLPPAPPGKCPPELQEKISTLYRKMIAEGRDMNKVIQDRKSFRNPSIYEKLIEFCDINELDTNYPPEIYDPLRWGKESHFDELAKAQKAEMDRREKERKERIAKIDFSMGAAAAAKRQHDAAADDELKRRKSKWDQAAPDTAASSNVVVKPAGLVQPALTSTATGTKGTVISAFGSLPKKPKI